ncbi:putative dsRNA-binding protein [Deinococcus koreensis]|uniref:RNA-binding protein n=1 Tax=Deinococcus koreensis TaxID=2054903 RepID=A0A2K3UXW4_9DEIO|nr:putative dsRNA-binding protein [Deinococcus koreensis]PNY81382.1 RNA-binding protein [Deinococcus koreensis]
MNAKGDLIARVLALGLGVPTFEAETSGPAHDRTFHATVLVGGRPLGAGGEGRSKKEAERVAAESALRALDGEPPGAAPPRPAGERWPIYAAVLAEALDAAVELSSDDATLDEVRADAARLYRDLLSDLGHGPEAEDA